MCHILLVFRMNVGWIAQIDGHRHGSVVEFKRLCLRVAERRPFGARLHGLRLKESGELDEIERQLLSPLASPVVYKGLEKRGILLVAAYVGATLIPQHPFDGHSLERMHHGVVEHRRIA